MPYTKEEMRAYNTKYRQTQKYKDYQKDYQKAYGQTQKYKDYKKAYNKTPKGIKNIKISKWKHSGIIDNDFDLLFDTYLNETHCWICGKKFILNKMYHGKCLDHDHKTGEPRYICCGYCNLKVLNKI